MIMPENAGKKQGNTRFRKGQSGNPCGKAKGTKNKATLAAEVLLEGELEGICRSLIAQAREGNIQAIKLVLDRVLPPKRNPTVSIELPQLKSSSDALEAITSITQAVGNGEISPAEGETLSRIVDVYVKALEAHDFENRLNILEEKGK
ncbi:conserved hypothetical protein (plasmid) [Waddlia chondrophila WSU 86-1044]|uniref:DUF5681 domain-containing protein n=2 Tax=Waddlia chondrophila TaxID=71667 RepID=D6YX16_WADCW|nr:conserved hypothetical protein [Waddlia chondrophila WSU 86-1044]